MWEMNPTWNFSKYTSSGYWQLVALRDFWRYVLHCIYVRLLIPFKFDVGQAFFSGSHPQYQMASQAIAVLYGLIYTSVYILGLIALRSRFTTEVIQVLRYISIIDSPIYFVCMALYMHSLHHMLITVTMTRISDSRIRLENILILQILGNLVPLALDLIVIILEVTGVNTTKWLLVRNGQANDYKHD